MKNTVITIVGPTAVGKTNLSIDIAKQFNGEIISGDSMQVYKEMDIGTAKITKEEMDNIPHYMIDIKKPNESFTVADFQSNVKMYINEISNKGKIPIIVGGSGLYIQAILYDYNFSKQIRNDEITRQLEETIAEEGIDKLYQRLEEIDPKQAEKIHPNNHRRVIRALEIYLETGKTMSAYEAEQIKESPYNNIIIGLEMDRSLLYERINERVDQMIDEGLLQEVAYLYETGYQDCQSMKAIGYKEFIPYFEGEQSLDRSIDLLKRNSRRYAKRQYTWFKNKMDGVNWYTSTPNVNNPINKDILKDLAGILK